MRRALLAALALAAATGADASDVRVLADVHASTLFRHPGRSPGSMTPRIYRVATVWNSESRPTSGMTEPGVGRSSPTATSTVFLRTQEPRTANAGARDPGLLPPQEHAGSAAPVARTSIGSVRGTSAGGHLVFRGLPYAAAPLGPRRFAPPAPPTRWPGVRDAAAPAPACTQQDYTWNRADYLHQSEDCLTLDVGTEALAGRRPVLVWIHGGANYAGSPGDMAESPIVARGIVMVGVRYRLGALGFLHHRSAGGGNLATQDQIAALRWVHENIARFGGDPDAVTIAGESAGAQDVGLLVAAPAARGLFRRAIMESGTPGFGLPWRSREEALRLGDQVDDALGARGDAAAMRSVAAWPLLVAGEATHDQLLTDDSYRWLRTTVDGTVFPAAPDRLLASAPGVDVLIGTNRIELDLPGGHSRRDTFVALSYPGREAEARRFYRLDQPEPRADPADRDGTRDQRIATDATFRCPAQRFVATMARRGGKVWRYLFDGSATGAPTRHALEIPFIYADQPLGRLHLIDYWANFVKTGDPNGAGLPSWPAADAAQTYLALDAAGARAAVPPAEDVCRWGDSL
ncbi:carboxylesterase/lipase family protein [Sphingomonas phyllosphaerae]|uniref:carboxylesterase/lipase family protein n=1 Tax=Sphingomonas phyllosphaerae TaxID=257003 RepID=UPI002412FC22|nr:carboxylesterase family protein [Sphingomonas phyllosphaerae]